MDCPIRILFTAPCECGRLYKIPQLKMNSSVSELCQGYVGWGWGVPLSPSQLLAVTKQSQFSPVYGAGGF